MYVYIYDWKIFIHSINQSIDYNGSGLSNIEPIGSMESMWEKNDQ